MFEEKYLQNVDSFCFPYIHTEHEYRVLTVERRGRVGDDRWAISDGSHCYQPKGRRWAYERSNSSRTEKFMRATRMTLEEALPIAEKQAQARKRMWDARLARMIARQEAVEAERAAQEAQEETDG
jgi:hypothetical protein